MLVAVGCYLRQNGAQSGVVSIKLGRSSEALASSRRG